MSPLEKKREWKGSLAATLNAVLSCRLREGYTIKEVYVFKEKINVR